MAKAAPWNVAGDGTHRHGEACQPVSRGHQVLTSRLAFSLVQALQPLTRLMAQWGSCSTCTLHCALPPFHALGCSAS